MLRLLKVTQPVNMAISNAAQFVLLLWKNWLLQKRRIVLTTFQILSPTLLALLLLLARFATKSELHRSPKIWDGFDPLTSPPVKENRTTRPLVLAFSPNTSLATTRMAYSVYQMLNATPIRNGISCLLSLY